jgi:hypothetical protein
MIFLIVDGAKKLRWKRADARQEVHMLCSRTIKETLRVMPEGYLCREQPGDLKYMVCFSSPKVRALGNSEGCDVAVCWHYHTGVGRLLAYQGMAAVSRRM